MTQREIDKMGIYGKLALLPDSLKKIREALAEVE